MKFWFGKNWKSSIAILSVAASTCTPIWAQNPAKRSEKVNRVAVFSQRQFPFYNVSALISPRDIARDLRVTGVKADELDAAYLSDAKTFNRQKYAALVLPYGNSFPDGAFANLQAFHRAGGSLIMSGVPFTHPTAQMGAQNWTTQPTWSEFVGVFNDGAAHGGQRALQIIGPERDWRGVASERFKVEPRDNVRIKAWTRTVSGDAGERDQLYVRFYDARGNFISQDGPKMAGGNEWRLIEGEMMTPLNARELDVSPQIWTPQRKVQLDDIELRVGGRAVDLGNPGFELPGIDWKDLGHRGALGDFTERGIGVGGFIDNVQGAVKIAEADPLQLKSLRRQWSGEKEMQAIDVKKLPAYVQVTPVLLKGGQPITVLLNHRAGPFKGAVDAWTNAPSSEDLDAYDYQQLLSRATIASLAARKLLTTAQRDRAFRLLDRQPKPRVWRNLKLPVVPRPYQTFQPKMPLPARRLHVVDMRGLGRDERLMLVTLQGIVNRKQPRIYLIFNNDNEFWLQQLVEKKSIDAYDKVENPLSLLQMFRGEINGAVIPDETMQLSQNVAVSIAGLDNLLVATAKLARENNLPIKRDLRGRFATNAQMIRFLRTDLLPRANKYLSICLDPPLLDNGSIDQIIAAKGLAFWITGPKQQSLPGANMRDELEEVKALFAQMPLLSVVRGFWWHGDGEGIDEGPGVSLGSRFGKVTCVSDMIANLSVFSGLPAPTLQQKRAPAPKLDPSKVYIAITMSDGDNIVTWPGYFRGYFDDPLHGTIPIGWGIAPTLREVAPNMVDWFYQRATTNDEFLCDVSGIAYIYPPDWGSALSDRPGALKAFYDWTQRSMKNMDLQTIRIMNVRTQDIPQVGKLLPDVKYLVPDYGFSGPKNYGEFTYTLPGGQNVFRAALEGQGQSPREKAENLKKRVGNVRPAFMNAFIWNWGSKMSDLKAMLEFLGPDYVAVTPSQLNDLYQQSRAQKP